MRDDPEQETVVEGSWGRGRRYYTRGDQSVVPRLVRKMGGRAVDRQTFLILAMARTYRGVHNGLGNPEH